MSTFLLKDHVWILFLDTIIKWIMFVTRLYVNRVVKQDKNMTQ